MKNRSLASLYNTPTRKQWLNIQARRRAGISIPLFSIHSSSSTGIGEITDLKLLVDWCVVTGHSVIQLLPMNDTGFGFKPYDSESSFALDPVYINLESLKGVNAKAYVKNIKKLKADFSTKNDRVDYGIKAAKLDLMWNIFIQNYPITNKHFDKFRKKTRYWLTDYAAYRVLKEIHNEKSWIDWPKKFKQRNPKALREIRNTHKHRFMFFEWVQWQLYEEFIQVKSYARKQGVYLMGDLPFLVSRDSADVWSYQKYFKLNLSSGAPPDDFHIMGQRWGMPPYNWKEIRRKGYDYVVHKLRFAENFYDLYRIDHAVGLFRIWTIPNDEPLEFAGKNGRFDPADDRLWESHGKDILLKMIKGSRMLPCAEDLGTVPSCSYKVLGELGIPGMDVQRWMRDEGRGRAFLPPSEYRDVSIGTMTTHDMSNVTAWWLWELGTVHEGELRYHCKKAGLQFRSVRKKLFCVKNCRYSRLRWKKSVNSIEKLIKLLNISIKAAEPFVQMHQRTYHEIDLFLKHLGVNSRQMSSGRKGAVEITREAFRKISESRSIFSIQCLIDLLFLEGFFARDPWKARINVPGICGNENWTLRLPITLERMLKIKSNRIFKNVLSRSGRLS